jgi:ABC-2 type transport system permease protein
MTRPLLPADARHAEVPSAFPAPTLATELTGTWRLVRLALRRDRVLLPVWVAGTVALLVLTVVSIVGLYQTEADRLQYATVAATNAVARAVDGPMSGTSLGAIVMTEIFGFLAVLVGIMSVQAVVRHTRLDEETGRAELVGSAIVGRHARLVAALVVVLVANVAIATAAAVTLVLAGLPSSGSLLAGLALGGIGLTFGAVAAVTAQVSATARGANGLGGLAVGVAFLLRAVGDALGTVDDTGLRVVSSWPSWLSPIGWGQQLRPFGGDHAWVLVLYAVAVLALVATAFVLTGHRDVGAGMRPVRPGPAVASPALTSPAGLAWRLQRGPLLGWGSGLLVAAAAFGAISDEVDELLETSDELVALLGEMGASEVLLDLYAAFMMALLAVVVGAYLTQAVLRMRAEEVAGRAEPVLATAVGRPGYLASHVLWAVAGASFVLLLVGLVAGTVGGLVTGEWGGRFGDWVLAAVVSLPAILVLGALTLAAIGWLPRFAVPVAWTAVVLSLVVGQFGGLFDLPQWALNLSPFTHVPAVPAEELRWLPLLVLTAVALVVGAIGAVGWRRRDLQV